MVFDIHEVKNIGDYTEKTEEKRTLYFAGEKAFLVVNKNTIEVRCDAKLAKLLCEKYETVMISRYFGKGGIEIVTSGQLPNDELNDLARLSYDLTTGNVAE